jgi:predicted DCC family thiol-disulfide oxidoreductase YuxK
VSATASTTVRADSGQHYLLWDGRCGFCRRSVEWIKRRDEDDRLFAVPYQEAPSPPMTPALSEACAKAVHVVTDDGRTYRAGRAVLFALDVIGHHFWAKVLATPPLVWFVELGYWIVARNRMLFSKFIFRRERC